MIPYLIIVILVASLIAVSLILSNRIKEISQTIGNYRNVDTENNKIIAEKNKLISKLQSMLSNESKQTVAYRNRTLELEDGIKDSVGIVLRNEVTKVDCIFDTDEMAALLLGTKYLIKEYYDQSDAVRYYMKIISKIEENLKLMIKIKDSKDINN